MAKGVCFMKKLLKILVLSLVSTSVLFFAGCESKDEGGSGNPVDKLVCNKNEAWISSEYEIITVYDEFDVEEEIKVKFGFVFYIEYSNYQNVVFTIVKENDSNWYLIDDFHQMINNGDNSPYSNMWSVNENILYFYDKDGNIVNEWEFSISENNLTIDEEKEVLSKESGITIIDDWLNIQ